MLLGCSSGHVTCKPEHSSTALSWLAFWRAMEYKPAPHLVLRIIYCLTTGDMTFSSSSRPHRWQDSNEQYIIF